MTGNQELEARYRTVIPRYEDLVKEVQFALEKAIKDAGLKVVGVLGRVKHVDSLLEKLGRKEYSDPLSEITDLAGVRVVCQFSPDVDVVRKIIDGLFSVLETVDKSASLGSEQMGYQGTHFVVRLGPKHKGSRYDGLADLKCEIQVRTILQDAWAQISHSLVYKSEASVPERERRELNNVSSLLEIAQSIFDRTRETRQHYSAEVKQKQGEPVEFLLQPIDRETVAAYTRLRYPDLPINENIQELLIKDLDHGRYKVLKDIDDVVTAAEPAVSAYRVEAPTLFKAGTDFITKSLGFVDETFRAHHPFASRTRQAFSKYAHLVKRSANDA